MNSKTVKARVKIIFLTIEIVGFIYITTALFNSSMLYQILLFAGFTIFYLIRDRAQLRIFLNFTKFLLIVITLLHTLFFIYKTISMGFDFSKSFYINRWDQIAIRIFILPNIFAFVNIMISRVSFIDLLIATNNSIKGKTIYILLISGVEVMERLRIYYEYHPLNIDNSNREKLIHYLAIPLTLFFGIQRGFEKRYETLLERERVILQSQKEYE